MSSATFPGQQAILAAIDAQAKASQANMQGQIAQLEFEAAVEKAMAEQQLAELGLQRQQQLQQAKDRQQQARRQQSRRESTSPAPDFVNINPADAARGLSASPQTGLENAVQLARGGSLAQQQLSQLQTQRAAQPAGGGLPPGSVPGLPAPGAAAPQIAQAGGPTGQPAAPQAPSAAAGGQGPFQAPPTIQQQTFTRATPFDPSLGIPASQQTTRVIPNVLTPFDAARLNQINQSNRFIRLQTLMEHFPIGAAAQMERAFQVDGIAGMAKVAEEGGFVSRVLKADELERSLTEAQIRVQNAQMGKLKAETDLLRRQLGTNAGLDVLMGYRSSPLPPQKLPSSNELENRMLKAFDDDGNLIDNVPFVQGLQADFLATQGVLWLPAERPNWWRRNAPGFLGGGQGTGHLRLPVNVILQRMALQNNLATATPENRAWLENTGLFEFSDLTSFRPISTGNPIIDVAANGIGELFLAALDNGVDVSQGSPLGIGNPGSTAVPAPVPGETELDRVDRVTGDEPGLLDTLLAPGRNPGASRKGPRRRR